MFNSPSLLEDTKKVEDTKRATPDTYLGSPFDVLLILRTPSCFSCWRQAAVFAEVFAVEEGFVEPHPQADVQPLLHLAVGEQVGIGQAEEVVILP